MKDYKVTVPAPDVSKEALDAAAAREIPVLYDADLSRRIGSLVGVEYDTQGNATLSLKITDAGAEIIEVLGEGVHTFPDFYTKIGTTGIYKPNAISISSQPPKPAPGKFETLVFEGFLRIAEQEGGCCSPAVILDGCDVTEMIQTTIETCFPDPKNTIHVQVPGKWRLILERLDES
jgi:hypothetical protein